MGRGPRRSLSTFEVADAEEFPTRKSRPRDSARRHHDTRRASYKDAQTYRDFCVWDGEGVDDGVNPQQAYCLFGNSEGGELCSPDSFLTTEQILSFLISEGERLPDHIHTGYAIKYDANMFMRTLPFEVQKRITEKGVGTFEHWRISYRAGKYFRVKDLRTKRNITIWDMLSFWSMKAVDACIQDPKIGPNDPRVKFIAPTKDDRGTFTFADLDNKIRPYFKVELELYKELIVNLRNALEEVDLVPSVWYGPSAVVSDLYKKRGLKKYMNRPVSDATRYRQDDRGKPKTASPAYKYTLPDQVNRAALDSFFGGRFELFSIGVHDGPAFEYDINSAYPDAMRYLPQLSEGRWRFVDLSELRSIRNAGGELPGSTHNFGFYRVFYRFDDDERSKAMFYKTRRYPPHPFAHRAPDSTVSFPQQFMGWVPYWTANAVWINCKNAQYLEAWVWEPANDFKPFASEECVNVPRMFTERNNFGANGRPDLKYVLKITLNSGYGKLAQTVGTGWGDDLPAYHQIEWAAHITDYCRARMWNYATRAYAQGTLVSVETDALFTTAPVEFCDKLCGDDLGDLKRIDFDGLIYVQSGIYFTKKKGSNDWDFHYRGLDRDAWTAEDITEYYRTLDATQKVWPAIQGINTVFNTNTLAGIRFDNPEKFYDKWLTWEKSSRDVTPSAPRLKRFHIPTLCMACRKGLSPAQSLHNLSSKPPVQLVSASKKAVWLGDKLTEDEKKIHALFLEKAVTI